jgi:hypothetical protein
MVIASAFVGLAVAGSASAASADAEAPQAITCRTATGTVEDLGGTRHYAAAKCDDPSPVTDWYFRLKWSCSGESFLRTSPWHVADGTLLRGYCPLGQAVDQVGVDRVRQQFTGS